MAVEETTLPHRVVRSAKDLASATLTGAAFELKDPRESKHVGTSTQASTCLHYLSSEAGPSRPGINTRGSSFRDGANDVSCRDAEEDFERFQELAAFQAEFPACLASLQDAIALQEETYGLAGVSLKTHDLEFNTVVKSHENGMINADKSTSRPSGLYGKRSVNGAHTAALRRLDLIGAHLQKNLAIQALQQDAYEQSHALMNEIGQHLQDEQTQKTNDDDGSTTHSTQGASHSYSDDRSMTSQRYDAVVHNETPPASFSEKEEDGLQRQFHCPYYACHRNLQLLSTSSSISSSSQRSCVHVGCNIHIETSDSWAEHIHKPHHNLLGSS